MIDSQERIASDIRPYKGLIPYTEEDARFFFGRDHARQILEANLSSSRLTLVYGATGVGKSSLLKAGVVHHLRQRAKRQLEEHGNPDFLVIEFASWQNDPLRGVTAAIAESVRLTLDKEPPVELPTCVSLTEAIRTCTSALDVDLLFIFDQFEEYFNYLPNRPFDELLAAAIEDTDLRSHFLIAIREDRLPALDRFKPLLRRNIFENLVRIDHLDLTAARDAITKPLDEYNRTASSSVAIEPELVAAVLSAVSDKGGAPEKADRAEGVRVQTPLLQLVMSQLWDTERAQGSDILRCETLEKLGGREAIFRHHLGTAIDQLSPAMQTVAARVFQYLVGPGGSKIAMGSRHLAHASGLPEVDVENVLRHLTSLDVRVLQRVAPLEGTTQVRYEILHDVLSEPVTTWSDEFRLTEQKAENERRLATSRRKVLLAAGLVVLVLVGAVWTNSARADANYQLQLTEALTATDPQDGMRSALQALELRRAPAAEAALRRHVSANRLTRVIDDHHSVAWGAEFNPEGDQVAIAYKGGRALVISVVTGEVLANLVGHEDEVLFVRFTLDGSRVVTASADGTARLWSVLTGDELRILDHRSGGEPVRVFLARTDVVGPEGSYIATGPLSGDGNLLVTSSGFSAWLWDLNSGALIAQFEHPYPVWDAAFSSDGTEVVTASLDGVARVWDLASKSTIEEYGEFGSGFETRPSDQAMLQATFDRSGRWLLTGYLSGSVSLWERGVSTPIDQTMWHSGKVVDIGFSADGRQFLTAGDQTVRIFDVDPFLSSTLYRGSLISSANFSPDGSLVITAEQDGTASVFSVVSGLPLVSFTGHTNIVWEASIAPDGRTGLTASEDQTVRIWQLPGALVMPGFGGGMAMATFDPTGSLVLTADYDGIARLRDSTTGEVITELRVEVADEGLVWPLVSASFDESGELIMTVQNNSVRLWQAETGRQIRTCCEIETGFPEGGAFSPGSQDLVAVSYSDNTVRLWDLGSDDPTEIHSFEDTIFIAWSQNGSVIVTQGRQENSPIRIWDGSTFAALHQWEAGLMRSMAMTPDGKTLITVGQAGSVQMWDVESGELRHTIGAGQARAWSVNVNREGDRFLVGGSDGAASVWQISDAAFLGSVPAHAEAVVSIDMTDDGRILTSAPDGNARVLNCEVCEANLEEVEAMARELLPSENLSSN